MPTAGEVLAAAADPRSAFLVLGSRRALGAEVGVPPSWREAELPPEVAAAARRRGIAVLVRAPAASRPGFR